MDRGLVIVSFGTSVPEARRAVSAVEEALERFASGWEMVRAFTSPTIRHILAGRGEKVSSLTEALEHLHSEGVRRIAVQPTHLLYGFEYDRLRAEAAALSGGFDALAVGRPLLADTADLRRFAAGLSETCPPENGGAVVLMGHGTKHFANAVYPALQTGLRLAGREDMLVGTVEGWPTLEDVARQLAARGPRRVRLVPLMLVAGEHARSDMADVWKRRLEEAGHTVECSFTGLGELPWVQKLYQEHLRELLESL